MMSSEYSYASETMAYEQANSRSASRFAEAQQVLAGGEFAAHSLF